MLRNYLKVSIRSLLKNRLYAFTNVLSLTVGLAACGLLGLYAYDEWRVDQFHEKGHRTYRVLTKALTEGKTSLTAGVGRPLARTIAQEVPGVERVVPVRRANFSVKSNNRYFFNDQLYADEHFLETFSFPLRAGNPQTALREPYSVVLTERTARTYFGDTPALGQTLLLNDSLAFRVTGVLADPPPSHLQFDVLLSLATFRARSGPEAETQWFTWDAFCYVVLPERADVTRAERKISALSMRHNGPEYRKNGYHVSHTLEPVNRIHLHSGAGGINRPAGSARQLYLLGAVGLFILGLACINFVNLTTAHQSQRAREVGVRKAIGAGYSALVGRFMSDSVLLAAVAGVLALAVVTMALPLLNQLTEKTIPLALLWHPYSLLLAVGFVLGTGLLAGWYPSLVLARFRPVDTLKGQTSTAAGGSWLRQGLVVVQFGISLVLLIATFVVGRQLRFMQSQALGFDRERVVVVDLRQTPRRRFIENYESIRQQMAALPNVQSVAGANALPGRAGWTGQLVWPEGRPQDQAVTLEVIPVDHDYVRTLGLTLKHGRDYSRQFSTDAQHGTLLNESACRALGWQPVEAVGKQLRTAGLDSGRVVGVVADFHQHGLQQPVQPLLTFIAPYAVGYLALRLGPGDVRQALGSVEGFWRSSFPGYEFTYFFLDEDFNRQYRTEQQLAKVFRVFAGLAIFIACLGLFGLAAFTAERRTKEIGVRKVLGASVGSIVALLSKDFLKPVLMAVLLASPLAWYAMNRWLQDFAYKIDVEWWIFALAGGLAVGIALLTVSFQSVRAALMNPVKSLRSE